MFRSGEGDGSVRDQRSGTGQLDVLAGQEPHPQPPTGDVDGPGGGGQVLAGPEARRDGGRGRTGAAGPGLPHAALVDPHGDVVRAERADQLHVGPPCRGGAHHGRSGQIDGRQVDGALTAEQAREETTTATRRFVRRQESWFRPDDRILWFDTTDPDVGLMAATTGVISQWTAMTDNG